MYVMTAMQCCVFFLSSSKRKKKVNPSFIHSTNEALMHHIDQSETEALSLQGTSKSEHGVSSKGPLKLK